eukprot:1130770-Rhodomonas_salina.3
MIQTGDIMIRTTAVQILTLRLVLGFGGKLTETHILSLLLEESPPEANPPRSGALRCCRVGRWTVAVDGEGATALGVSV